MDQPPADDWRRRVHVALELADIRGPKANVERNGRGYDRVAGLGRTFTPKWSEAKVNRWLRQKEWEPYVLEAWLHRIADVAELPYDFFTVPDLRALVRDALASEAATQSAAGRHVREKPLQPGSRQPKKQQAE